VSKDPWEGSYTRPLLQNPWLYADGNPVNHIDPTGYFPIWCQSMPNKATYELCVLTYYHLQPISYAELGQRVEGSKGCYTGPTAYRAPGYLEGLGVAIFANRLGSEVVYDFARMEQATFSYIGGGANDAINIGVGVAFYAGYIGGLRSDRSLLESYRGLSFSVTAGPSLDLGFGTGAGGGLFRSWNDLMLNGVIWYVGGSLGVDLAEGLDLDASPIVIYVPSSPSNSYVIPGGKIDIGRLSSHILSGKHSIWGNGINKAAALVSRLYAVALARHYANAYQEINNENGINQ